MTANKTKTNQVVDSSSGEIPRVDIDRLVQGCIDGDKSCYGQLIQIYSGKLLGFYIHMGYRPDQAEDFVQELFIKLIDKLGKYKNQGYFDAWLFRVAANMARDFSRKKKLKTVSLSAKSDDGENSNIEISDKKQESPIEELLSRELQVELSEALDQLTDQEREFIVMRHYGRMGFKDIARESGMPIGTVLSKVHRGLKKLKEIMT